MCKVTFPQHVCLPCSTHILFKNVKKNSRCKLLDTEHWVSELEKFYYSFGCTSSFYRLQIWAGDRVENISKVSWLVWEQNLIWSQNWNSSAISNLSSPLVKPFAWLLDCTIWGNKYAYKIIWIDLVWMNHKEVRKNQRKWERQDLWSNENV